MNARHDASYKHLFSSPKVVQHLIEGFLPAAKRLGRLDFSTLEKVSASYVSDDLRERADDVIWRIKTDKDWLYLTKQRDTHLFPEWWRGWRIGFGGGDSTT
jgi:predicted transposase YdaD